MRRVALVCFLLASSDAARAETVRTFDGRHSINEITVMAVYFVPEGRMLLPDWRERVDYYAARLEAFHTREFGGRSTLKVTVIPAPLRSPHSPDEMRGGNQNGIFWRTVKEVRTALQWPERNGGVFPILLILSDINWRELDDFRRARMVDGTWQHEGHVGGDGRHFPGAESGGARAVYLADEGAGVGLVSADGWRVPYSGSDCVVYHEGVGHTIGLPHPDPMNDSVMGTAQYRFWLNETWLDAAQKVKLGLTAKGAARQLHSDLFSIFAALPEPLVPAPGEPVTLKITMPAGAEVKTQTVETQTQLFDPWKTHATASLGAFPGPTPVSYRIRLTLTDGQTTQLWGYFQVKAAPGVTPPQQ